MKIPDIPIYDLIESKMNEIINKINETNSRIEADPLHSELSILDCFSRTSGSIYVMYEDSL
jgi:hypothetical protein